MIFTLTMTVSPGWKSGISLPAESFAICSFSISLSKFMTNSPSAALCDARLRPGSSGLGELLRHRAEFVTLRSSGPRPAAEAAQEGRPEVRPARLSQPLGLGAAPGGDLGVVARGKDFGDRPALPDLGAGVVRIFQEPVRKALLGARGCRAHD